MWTTHRTLDGTMCQRHMHVSYSMRVRSGELQSTYQISKGNHFSWTGLIQVVSFFLWCTAKTCAQRQVLCMFAMPWYTAPRA